MRSPIPWLCWSLPVVGALLTPLLAKVHPRVRDYTAVFFSLLAAVMAGLMIPNLLAESYYEDVLTVWIDLSAGSGPGVPVDLALGPHCRSEACALKPGGAVGLGVLVDPLSIIMANVVALAGFLAMVYSIGSMRDDPCLTRYWTLMNLFIGSMLLLVLSNNLILFLVGWEGVGLCTWSLIGYYYRDRRERWVGGPPPSPVYPPSECGMKSYIAIVLGDVLMISAIIIVHSFAQTLSFVELFETAPTWLPEMGRFPGLLALTSLLILGGPLAKDAQFPFHEWLPEATACPSAALALMLVVKAGVYTVARVLPIFYIGYWLLGCTEAIAFFVALGCIGAFTAFMAGTQAMVSSELKRVLAYSTMSQKGYMMMGLGCAGLGEHALLIGLAAAVFHLVSHALFKATLFMSAGSVVRACRSIHMPDMGGLRRVMPFTHALMLLAGLSLSGVPPLSGFWSKDAILVASLEAGQYALFAAGAVTAAITIFYTVRFMAMTFWWKESERVEELEREGEIGEAPAVMWVPYAVLTALMVAVGLAGVAGLLGLPGPEQFLHCKLEWLAHEYIFARVPHALHQAGIAAKGVEGAAVPAHEIGVITSLAMLAVGGVAAYRVYVARRPAPDEIVERHGSLRALWGFLWKRWYLNPVYYSVFVGGTLGLGRGLFDALERGVIDRISDAVSGATVALSRWSHRFVESRGIDEGLNVGVPRLFVALYHGVKRIQTGVLSYNMLYIALTLIVILIIFLGSV